MDSRTFYDNFASRQLAVGVNERHRAILGWLRRFGLRRDHRVMEIGCGVGTVTGLLAGFLNGRGSIFATDLSPRSVEAAASNLAGTRNVILRAGDVLEIEVEGPFDVLVLPDVIEHIPLNLHPRLFGRLARWVASDGFILLHYPNPLHLEWCHLHRPEQLQLIDQPVHADNLTQNAYAAGLYLDYLQTYSIWVREGDYVVAVLRPRRDPMTFTDLPEKKPSIMARVRGKVERVRREGIFRGKGRMGQ